MDKIFLVGYGGHAKSVADSIERTGKYNIVGYTDLQSYDDAQYNYLGTDDEFQNIYNSGVKYAAICVGYLGHGKVRELIAKKLTTIGFELPVIIDPSAIVSKNSMIGDGTFVGKGAIINVDSKIGRCCIINTGAIIEHDCEVDDFAHISVASVLCGGVMVGRAAFVGANATVIQGKTVEANVIVPAGAVIR